MVKARMRKKVAAANQAVTEMDGEDDPGSKEEADAELDATMSSLAGHQKRKVTKRAKFLEKIRVATANKMKKSGKKNGMSAAFSDFATLEFTLGDIARKGMSPGRKDKPVVLRAKARTKLAATESRRMQQVLAHPTFQTNPIAAISNHIAASLKAKPPETKKLAPSLEAKAEALAGRKKGKKQQRTHMQVVDDASDAVAIATQARASDAADRGINFRGGDAHLGVRRSHQKKGQGGKKGSKRGEKRKKETW